MDDKDKKLTIVTDKNSGQFIPNPESCNLVNDNKELEEAEAKLRKAIEELKGIKGKPDPDDNE